MDAIIRTGKISKREYDIVANLDVSVSMGDGVKINVDIFRPDDKGKFPVLIGMSPFNKDYQRDHVWPAPPMSQRIRGLTDADLEAGPTDFFVRRGYVHIIGSVRGTGRSGGVYRYLDKREITDVYELIEWAAGQPWCNGNVSLLGIAYFAEHQPAVATLQPPHLKCIAPMFAFWDNYRYFWWTGGILWSGFLRWLFSPVDMDIHTQESVLRNELGDKRFKEIIAHTLLDNDI